LFAGIGGLDLGLEQSGFRCAWQVEQNEYCRRVLEKHWPNVRRWDNVRTFPPEDGKDWSADIVCGGFPCQDLSLAGLREGLEQGARSSLWFEMLRIIRILRPRYALVENVPGLLVRDMGAVLGSLAEVGYDAEWQVLSAADCGACHLRERVFLLAYPNRLDGEKGVGPKQNGQSAILDGIAEQRMDVWVQAPPAPDRIGDGVPAGSYADRVTALGNAVVPQVALAIGLALQRHENGKDECSNGRDM
jgi:DNA (cytosine-5)-methyltransferase 1